MSLLLLRKVCLRPAVTISLLYVTIALLYLTIALLCLTVPCQAEKTGLQILKERLAKMEETNNKLFDILARQLPFIVIPPEGRTLFADVNSSEIIALTEKKRYVVLDIGKDKGNLIMMKVVSLKDPKNYWLAFSPGDELPDEKINKEIRDKKIEFANFRIW